MVKVPLKVCFLGGILLVNVLTGCSKVERADVANNETNTPIIQTTEENLPSDEQLAHWQMDSFRPVLDKWIKGEKLPKHVELIRNDTWAANSELGASVTLLDVNGDRTNELALQSGCATVGNCVFWLFEMKGNGYKQLLNTQMVQRYKLRKTRSNGYYDLETSAHGSSTSGGIAVYKFDGFEYKIAECFGYEYERTGKFKNGQALTRDSPTLTPSDCLKWP